MGVDTATEWTAVEVGVLSAPVAETEVAGMTVAFQVSGRHAQPRMATYSKLGC